MTGENRRNQDRQENRAPDAMTVPIVYIYIYILNTCIYIYISTYVCKYIRIKYVFGLRLPGTRTIVLTHAKGNRFNKAKNAVYNEKPINPKTQSSTVDVEEGRKKK